MSFVFLTDCKLTKFVGEAKEERRGRVARGWGGFKYGRIHPSHLKVPERCTLPQCTCTWSLVGSWPGLRYLSRYCSLYLAGCRGHSGGEDHNALIVGFVEF